MYFTHTKHKYYIRKERSCLFREGGKKQHCQKTVFELDVDVTYLLVVTNDSIFLFNYL